MSVVDKIVEFNEGFVNNEEYVSYVSDKYPTKKLAVLSCMDTRLTELLPAALNIKNGDVKVIKNAGGVISHPFGSVMRSLLVAIYELGVEEIMVVGHTDCGMEGLDVAQMMDKMKARGVAKKDIDMIGYCGFDLKKWLYGFGDVNSSVIESVNIITNHPLIPNDVKIHGFVIDIDTGKLNRVL